MIVVVACCLRKYIAIVWSMCIVGWYLERRLWRPYRILLFCDCSLMRSIYWGFYYLLVAWGTEGERIDIVSSSSPWDLLDDDS